uniref:Protein phosphatase 1 regulatory subunit 7 n=1 Tax=Hanusia phi TaxID=3032 RepID=A0A7S0EKS8_9CRYP|mmetsp:Transcript_26593/g.60659  ORF Transcript_26593/g.60659 Transcript_26593/m.60659 type:complete len:230 (+) Transcript_26593:203-892(+)
METKISHSLIKAVSGEFDLESVYKLTLNRMNIRAIENLEGCVNLQELNLSNNEIERIQGLEKLQSLRKITLTSNKISSLQGLDKCAALEHIFVQDNMIDNISEIANVSALKNLKSLYLRNIDGSQKNPVCDHPSYRSSIVRQLPHISILDGERLKHSNTLYADASSSQTTSTAQVQIPESKSWLSGFTWEEDKDDVDKLLAPIQAKFDAVMSDSKKLNAAAVALLSHYQ